MNEGHGGGRKRISGRGKGFQIDEVVFTKAYR